MTQPYTTNLRQQPSMRDGFRFFFKNHNTAFANTAQHDLSDLVRGKLRIAIVTETWPPEINGVALSLLELCKGLQRNGHKILLIRPTQQSTIHSFQPDQECLVTAASIPRYRHMQFGWPQYLKISKALENFTPDVVHIVTEGPLGLTVLQAAKFKKIPVSSGFHSAFQDFSRFFDLAFLVHPIQHYLKWFHNNTQLTCVPSRDTANTLRNFGVTCPLTVIETGVDVQKFSSEFRSTWTRQVWGVTEDTTVMIYVGRLSPEKEIQLLLERYTLMKKIPNKKIKLVIVGDGPDRDRLIKLSQMQDVIFTGNLSGTQLSNAFASADVFVFPSQVETFGNVVLEAMASGLPVIAYDAACARKHLDAQSGWLAPLGDSQQFQHHMMHLPHNRILHQMGQYAMQKVQNLGWQHSVDQLEQALYQVAREVV